VTTAHETSNAFSDEVLKEHQYFEMNKQEEMREMLQSYADGQVEMLRRSMEDWDRVSASRSYGVLICTDYPYFAADQGRHMIHRSLRRLKGGDSVHLYAP
jgi:hypothetical protein